MSNRSRFAGRYNANDYNYGGLGSTTPGPLVVSTGNSATGVGTLTLTLGQVTLSDGTNFAPLNINAPILVGAGSNAEIVTPTAVSNASPSVPYTTTVTATFANLHGGDPVASATFGLQEAINAADAAGGGIVVVNGQWFQNGGTVTIIQAATLPTNGGVKIEDITSSPVLTYANSPSSVTVLAVPATATSAVVASQTGTGTWAASTTHVVFSYVTACGGETLTSADYSFTATLNVPIGGSGPIAATGAVGYRVYIGTTAWLAPVIAANGTVIQCGPLAAFKIGTPFSIAALTTSALATIPLQSTAFGGVKPMPFASPNMVEKFQTVYGPFAATSTVTAGTALEWGHVQLPTGFLNQIGRTLRLTILGYFTPVSTATVIMTVKLASVFGTTTTTMFTVTTPASSGTTAANINLTVYMTTAATGAAGTIESHGSMLWGGATATAGLLVAAGDSVQAVSSAADLTLQDCLQVTINSGTANLTTSQLRTMIVEVLS